MRTTHIPFRVNYIKPISMVAVRHWSADFSTVNRGYSGQICGHSDASNLRRIIVVVRLNYFVAAI